MLGAARAGRLDYRAAIGAYAEAVRRAPTRSDLLNNLGCACRDDGQAALAAQVLAAAVALSPDEPDLHNNHAMALLGAGRFAEGFAEYEWRWRMPLMPPHGIAVPQWQGEDIAGRRILVHEEGGFGDMLQFIRYVPLLAARGATVAVRAHVPLHRLLARLPGVSALLPPGAPADAAGPIDLHAPVMSLPHAFGTTFDTVPDAPYLTADPDAAAAWEAWLHDRCGARGTSLRVGLVWAGAARANPELARMDRKRSLPLAELAPLAGPGRQFVSLQIGPAAAQQPPEGPALHDPTALIGDFADTAALIAGLDMVVSVDTSTAHLAAAMGKPVLMLSRYDQCWRWLPGTEHSPWYPTLRVLRQAAPGQWDAPVRRAVALLEEKESSFSEEKEAKRLLFV